MTLPMMGKALVLLSLLASLAALGTGVSGRRRPLVALLRAAIGLGAVAILLLEVALVQSDFRLTYVIDNTAVSLPLQYKLAALWAGQQGTILLWAWMLLLLGHGLLKRETSARPAATLTVVALGAGLLGLLMLRSPFATVIGDLPPDGHGLNPLLQNPWMMIHPPVLFAGYALLTVPFALALAGWVRRDYHAWVDLGRVYLLWGWVLLGAGMMLGGYWAYITLGWGGFWGWDPVENASLVPWLVATAALHSLSLQRRLGAAARLNYGLAALTFVMVVYGSYLTRSGVLGDFSVHSFETMGAGYNFGWLTLLFVPALVALGVLGKRWGELEDRRIPEESAWLLVGTWIVTIMAFGVWVGMSMPLLSKAVGSQGGKGFAVVPSFYNRTQTVLLTGAGLALLLQMRPRSNARWVVIGLLALIGTLSVGLTTTVTDEHTALVRFGLALCAMAVGTMTALGLLRLRDGARKRSPRLMGTGLAHAGLALMMLGAMISGPGESGRRLQLALNDSQPTPYGTLAFKNAEEPGEGKLRLTVALDGRSGSALLYRSGEREVRNPVLFHKVWGDIYVEPVEVSEPQGSAHTEQLRKGETKKLDGVSVTFEAFDMSKAEHMADGGAMEIGARLKIDRGKGAETAVPTLETTPNGLVPKGKATVGPYVFTFEKMDVDSHSVTVGMDNKDKPTKAKSGPLLTVQVTRKPMIALVWLGTLVLLAGGLVALGGTRTGTPGAEAGGR